MKWVKVDHFTGKAIDDKGWHICDYIAGEYKATVTDNGRWILTKNGIEIGKFKTLKAAKTEAESQMA